MSLDTALAIASGGLANINRQMALVSQNIANASTPDYAAQRGTQASLTAEGLSLGVLSGPSRRSVDAELQAAVFQQGAGVAGLRTAATSLAMIDAALGTPGQGNELGSRVGDLRDQFSTLLTDPSSQAQQFRVVASADSLAQGIRTLSDAYGTQRQAAHDDLRAALGDLNRALTHIGSLSSQIVRLRLDGRSTADLESQRDVAVRTVSDLVGVKALVQANGDMRLVTTAGLVLPTRQDDAFSLADTSVQPATFYPGGGIPAVLLGGQDITRQLQGGRIGADLALRDATLPTFQAELDEFAQALANRFHEQGLTLFTDNTGAVPASVAPPAQSGYVGFAGFIQVNPAIGAAPSLVRDGTGTVIGSPGGASAFTPNPSGGPAGFTTMISRVLNFSLGALAQPGVPQPAIATTGLGPAGTLSAPYASPATLGDLASALVNAQSQASADVTTDLDAAQAMHDSLSSRLSSESGVNMDTEMSTMLTLQTAYSANARVLTVVQALLSELMNAAR